MKRSFIRWRKFVPVSGTFGRLTVMWSAGLNANHRSQWLCCCSCGRMKVVLGNSLLSGHSRSCGCVGRAAIVAWNLVNAGQPWSPERIANFVRQTHCKRGHERTPQNLRSNSGACRICDNERRRAQYDPEKRAQRHQAARFKPSATELVT